MTKQFSAKKWTNYEQPSPWEGGIQFFAATIQWKEVQTSHNSLKKMVSNLLWSVYLPKKNSNEVIQMKTMRISKKQSNAHKETLKISLIAIISKWLTEPSVNNFSLSWKEKKYFVKICVKKLHCYRYSYSIIHRFCF